jgi:glycosyltransferase involved in cell wall biosynthesis
MKPVAFFLPNLAGGGAEKVAINLLKGLLQQSVCLDLVLASADGPFMNRIPEGVRVIDLAAGRVSKAIIPLAQYLRERQPQALLSHLNYANVAAVLAKKIARTKTKLILVEHNTVSAHKSKVQSFKLVNRLMKILYPEADYVVAVSKDASQDLEQYLGFTQKRVRTIYNPVVDQDLFAKAQESLVHPWFQPDSPPVFLGVGRLIELKDFGSLIKAFGLLRRAKAARLLILGEGEQREELEHLIQDLELFDDVMLGGFVDNPFVYMKRASAFVLSSRSEGLPNVLIEAMACGCPVISTDCQTGPREILDSGKYGVLVPVSDEVALCEAMLRVLESPNIEREKLVSRSLHLASIEKATLEYLSLINN